MSDTVFSKSDSISRRNFMTQVAQATLGVGVAGAFHSRAAEITSSYAPAKRVIYLYMDGGMSHLDTLSPKGRGVYKSINTSAHGIQVTELLPKVAQQMHHIAIVESMTSTQGAHAEGAYAMHTNYTKRGTIEHPGLGSWVARYAGRMNPTLPPNVAINRGRIYGAGYMDARYSPLPIGNPNDGLKNSSEPVWVEAKDLKEQRDATLKMNQRFVDKYKSKKVKGYQDVYQEALRLMRSDDLKVFDLSLESSEMRAAYGDNSFGQGCLLARRLVEREVRFVEVGLGGWDHHNNIETLIPAKAEVLDTAMSALLADLHSRGLLEETLVVLSTEFGRGPEINPEKGRGHHPKVFSCAFAGGGVKGGQIYGKADSKGHDVAENAVRISDFNATIATAMGLPHEERIFAPNGRPFTLGNKGKAINIF